MRYIVQPSENDAPDGFKRWKRAHPKAPYSKFKEARAKRALKESLIARQKNICCYCESRISGDTSHIEHIEPQFGGLSAKSMTYSNLAASCIKDPKKTDPNFNPEFGVIGDSLLHCGHARGTHLVVSPYDPKCERLFFYSFSGEIKVNPRLIDESEIKLAKESIEFLRLNVQTLVSLRKLAMFETVKMLDNKISANDVLREINGRLPPFVSSAKAAIAAWKASRGES